MVMDTTVLKVTAALALLTLGEPVFAQQGGGTAPFVVKYANIQWFDPVYVADEKGWFAEEGLRIQWVGELPAGQLVSAVANGSIDFANRHTPLVLTTIAGGGKVKIIASGAQTTADHPHMKYLVLPASTLASIRDFRGRKVGINSFGACAEYVLREYLRRNGLDSGVEFVVVPDANQEQALKQGLIDVAVMHSPYYEKVVKTGAAREVFNDTAVDNGISGMLPYFANTAFIARHPDVVRKFVSVLARAADWTNAHHEEAGLIFAKRRGLDPQYSGSWHYYDHVLVPGDAPVRWWIDQLIKEKVLTPGQIEAGNVYTNQFNPYANQ